VSAQTVNGITENLRGNGSQTRRTG
jgi:hypothetical protein